MNHSSVLSLIAGRLVITFTLAAGAAVIWLAIGIPIGVLSAVRRRSLWDRAALGFALFFVSAPVFWLGLVFLWLFWYKLGIAAGTGYYSPAQYGVLTWLNHMLLPWFTLALLYAGWYARMTRGSVLDTLKQDFVRTARGKGLAESRVLVRHVLRASLTPVLTMFGMDLAALVSGTVIVEVVFNLNGARAVGRAGRDVRRHPLGAGRHGWRLRWRSCSPTWSWTSSTPTSTPGFAMTDAARAPPPPPPPLPAGRPRRKDEP